MQRIIRTRRGVRIMAGDAVLSEVLRRPGPTHSIYDALAACVVALAPGPRVALLGFAGGGLVAPLRALGFEHALDAVDLSLAGARVFRRLSRGWGGPIRLVRDDAGHWLARHPQAFDLIIEDLSIDDAGRTIKPPISLDRLPRLVRRSLAPGGVAVTNVLPLPGRSWREILRGIAAPHAGARVVVFEDWENRLVLAGQRLAPAAEIGRRLRSALADVGSELAGSTSVRALVYQDAEKRGQLPKS